MKSRKGKGRKEERVGKGGGRERLSEHTQGISHWLRDTRSGMAVHSTRHDGRRVSVSQGEATAPTMHRGGTQKQFPRWLQAGSLQLKQTMSGPQSSGAQPGQPTAGLAQPAVISLLPSVAELLCPGDQGSLCAWETNGCSRG